MENKNMAERIRNFTDKYLNKFISRKLFTLILATFLLLYGVLDAGTWATIACVYIGVEGMRDSVIAYKDKQEVPIDLVEPNDGKV
jgi:hypothetical protein